MAAHAFSVSLILRWNWRGWLVGWRAWLRRISWTDHDPHLAASHRQFLGNKNAVLQFARPAHKVADFNIGKGDALIPTFERSVFIYLNVLGLTVRTGDGELGFVDGLYFAGDEFLTQVFAIESTRSRTHALSPALPHHLDHLRVHHPDHRGFHHAVFQVAAGKNHVVGLDLIQLNRLALFGDACVFSDFHRDGIATSQRSKDQRIFANRGHFAYHAFTGRHVSAATFLRLRPSRRQAQHHNQQQASLHFSCSLWETRFCRRLSL